MNDRGVALLLVLLVMLTLSALAMSLAMMIATESRVTANYRDGIAVLYGAEAALERVLSDLAVESDSNRVLAGLVTSSFVDGPPGLRRLPDGTFTDLRALTAMVSCGHTVCSDADLDQSHGERPWGPNNPRWQLYGYGPLPGDSRVYTVVWIADDPAETDDDPFTDGGGEANPGLGRLSVMAHGYGPARTRRAIEATLVRDDRGFTVLSWREVR